MSIGIGQGQGDEFLFFSLRYRFLRSAEVQIALGADLDKDQIVLLLGDDVNLSMMAAETRLANAIAPLFEEFLGCFLPQLTNFLTVHHPHLIFFPQGRGNSVCTTFFPFKEGGFWLAMRFLTGAKYRR